MNEKDERAEFEAWYRKEIANSTMYRRDVNGSDRFGEYCQWFHEDSWKAWKARATQASEVEQDKRAAFEKWVTEKAGPLRCECNLHGEYKDPLVYDWWTAWEACSLTASEV